MSLRQLTEAAESKLSASWDAPAQLWALLAEVHRDRKQRRDPYTAADVHPFLRRHKETAPRTWKQLGSDLKNGC